jgi:hypothetical protein
MAAHKCVGESRGLNSPRVGVDVTRLLWKPPHMSNKRTSRRQFLHRVGVAAGVAAAPLARRGFAQAKRQVTMRLD